MSRCMSNTTCGPLAISAPSASPRSRSPTATLAGGPAYTAAARSRASHSPSLGPSAALPASQAAFSTSRCCVRSIRNCSCPPANLPSSRARRAASRVSTSLCQPASMPAGRSGAHGPALDRNAAIVVPHCDATAAPLRSPTYTSAASASEANHLGAAAPSRRQKCPTATSPISNKAGAAATPTPPPPCLAGSNTNAEPGGAKCAAPL